MDWERRRKLMLRWSILTAAAIALFWTIYYLVVGSVPVVSSIRLTPDSIFTLPFGISRWWDILLGPIFSCIFVLLFTNKKIMKDEDLVFGLGVGLVSGLGAGLGVGLGVGLVVGLVFGLVVGLVVGLVTLLKYIFSKKFWKTASDWMMAR